MAKIDLNDLSDAMTLSDDPTSEAWVNLITGAIHIRSDLIGRDDLPDDIETSPQEGSVCSFLAVSRRVQRPGQMA